MNRRAFWKRLAGGAAAIIAAREVLPVAMPSEVVVTPMPAPFLGYSQTGVLDQSNWSYSNWTQTITTNASVGVTIYVLNDSGSWALTNGEWTKF